MDAEGETGDLSIEKLILCLSRRGGVDQALGKHRVWPPSCAASGPLLLPSRGHPEGSERAKAACLGTPRRSPECKALDRGIALTASRIVL
jgi:hypothetical protein